MGSGSILLQVVEAQKILEENYNISANVWSITSYNELRREAMNVERWNMLHPTKPPKKPYISQCLDGNDGVFVAATDYMKTLPDAISKWIPGTLIALGTDGFGRSDSRKALRDFFEVDARTIVFAALGALYQSNKIKANIIEKALKDLDINPDKKNPMIS